MDNKKIFPSRKDGTKAYVLFKPHENKKPIGIWSDEQKAYIKEQLVNTGDVGRELYFDWQKTLKESKHKALSNANNRLREMKDRLQWGGRFGFDLSVLDNEKICAYCEGRAKRVQELMPEYPKGEKTEDELWSLKERIEVVGRLEVHGMAIDLPADESKWDDILKGMHARISDAVWWRRKLKNAQKRAVEGVARDIGLVQKWKGGYCSNLSLFNQRSQNSRNARLMDEMLAENEVGDTFYLSELQDKSISNPEVRRAELMTRIRGFEILAERMNYKAAFWTITCPSKYHAFYSSGGKNEKHNGESVRDGQQYLCKVWAGFRAWLKRNGIDGFGFRVAEPHHDGCPHWHILYFAPETDLQKATIELEERSLKEDGEEFGATRNRFKVEWIERGEDDQGRTLSAAAYIAKYIAKSIDGFQVGYDKETDQDTRVSSERVVTWSRVWGIRQFQQIGGSPVGLWRELRRLDGVEKEDTDNAFLREAQNEIFSLHEQIESYEDKAEAWAVFNMLVGSGRETLFKLWKTDIPDQINISQFIEYDPETGEVLGKNWNTKETGAERRNQYGEIVSVVKGLVFDVFGSLQNIRTRFHEWSIKRTEQRRERGGVDFEEVAQPLLI